MIIMEHCGGASPICGGIPRASKATGEKRELTVKEFAEILQAALQGIQSIGERSFGRGAVVGDKTLVDALAPCVDSWLDSASNEVDVKLPLKRCRSWLRVHERNRSSHGPRWYSWRKKFRIP